MDIELGTQLIDSLRVGLILLDHAGRVISWNGWMKRHSGLSLADVSSRRLDELFPEIVGTRLESSISDTLRFKLSSMLAPSLNPNVLPLYHNPGDRKLKQRMQQLIYISPLRHEHCACLIQIHDMTAAMRRERRLRAQSTQLIETSYQDALTGVGNRRRFDQDLAQRFRQAKDKQRPIAMLMIDVDSFKAYNDHFGHQGGDQCLIQVARALQEALRRDGDRVSRYGGEEFALLLAETDREAAVAIAERLRLAVEQLNIPHPAAPALGRVSVSIGISAMIPSEEQLCYILVAQADLALYSAKDAGRNRCMWYDPESGAARPLSARIADSERTGSSESHES
ncbi:sensor domain-containing diguanylate cyclase [Allochromatium palmeri]|uniref:diguanylate cyclase n=1 Tax=Allochromatium palmeri TaxID=231048 RepID=A0A6N8EGD9_9GAMM|nr:diguanylate cyclase [Allochromatium palmeri]MTW21414.1 diguanylate cyclase [Allochromatium palmeri]